MLEINFVFFSFVNHFIPNVVTLDRDLWEKNLFIYLQNKQSW